MRHLSDIRLVLCCTGKSLKSYVELTVRLTHDRCYAEASAGAYGTYDGHTRSRVEGSGWTYAEEAKSSTVIEDE